MSASSRSRWRARLAGLRIDVTPLRTSRDFRVLFVAGFVFFLGAMVGYVAVPFQLYALTGSNFAVGAYGLVQLVPLVLAGLYGGALADRLDRRRVLVLTGVAQVAGTAVLLVNALAPRPSLPVIYGVGVLLAVAQSLQSPSREALVPRTVRHAELPAAVALSSVGAQVGMLAGPALGGVLLASAGAPWAYGVTLAGFAVATALFARCAPTRRWRSRPRRGRCARSATASSTRCAVPTCSAPTSSTWSRCSSRCRWCCSPRWPPTCSSGRRCWACSTRPAPWGRCWRRRRAGGRPGCTTTAARWCCRRPAGARRWCSPG